MQNEHTKHEESKFIEVAISTTSGFYPETGFDRLPIHQKLEVQLKTAAKELRLTDTSGWITTVCKVAVDPTRSYEDNGLKGQVEIDWGPREGGGGHA